MKCKILHLVIVMSLSSYSFANDEPKEIYSGSVTTSVNALSKEGFGCATGKAKPFLLSTLPKFFSSEFGRAGLLMGKDNGKYKIALVLDVNSKLAGYQVGENTDEKSNVVQSVLNIQQYPELPKMAACIAGKPFIYEFTFK
jgi:hypothetical protein